MAQRNAKELREQAIKDAEMFRLEQAKINYEHACTNVIRFCEECLDGVIADFFTKKGYLNFRMRLLVSMFTDELGNKLFKVVTSERKGKSPHGREYQSPSSCDFDYKTFQKYLKQHGFRCVQERDKEPYETFYLGRMYATVLNITVLSKPLDRDANVCYNEDTE